jgi:DNA-binding transcriptional LysR family regulator
VAVQISQIRYFLALCEERNFTRAARRCGVSQPSMTNAIKALEAELGATLFHRGLDGARLTTFGAKVERYFKVIQRCVDDIRRSRGTHAVAGRGEPKRVRSARKVVATWERGPRRASW